MKLPASHILYQSPQSGFTLIEVMLVIVIISIFSALAVLSIGNVEQRRVMQQREQLINDLNVVRLESNDQSRVFALIVQQASATQPAGYSFAEYQPPVNPLTTATQRQRQPVTVEKKPLWKAVDVFKSRALSENAFLQVRRMDNVPASSPQEGLTDQQSPDLIWFGNGEVKPVRLQIIYNNQPLGNPVYVNAIGAVSDSEQAGS